VGNLKALAELYSDVNMTHSQQLIRQANATRDALNHLAVSPITRLYADGLDSEARPLNHSAWHATVFPAAFGLAPEDEWPAALAFLRSKRMAGSVYAAFYALRALYELDSDHGAFALELMTTCDTNSWCHMLNVGATAVMEAWSREEKDNLSWSHPWASAPASAIAWGFFGIQPTAPGFRSFRVKPQPGNVTAASIKVPTLSGSIEASISQKLSATGAVTHIRLMLDMPASTHATVCLPKLGSAKATLMIDGSEIAGFHQRDYTCVENIGSSATKRIIESPAV